MIDFSDFLALADIDLGPMQPKPTTIEGDQTEAAKDLFVSPDGRVEIGVWQCTPGRFTADRSATSEFCHLIRGLVELTHVDGRVQRFGPGDAFNLPLGWKGEWRVIEEVRKLYVIIRK
ncbi:MAG: cupin domain-containing protein [Paracoccaceae bacterium]